MSNLDNKTMEAEPTNARGELVLKKVVNCGMVNVRAEPNPNGDNILKTLGCGETILSAPDPVGNYYKVRLGAKEYGYIQKDYLA